MTGSLSRRCRSLRTLAIVVLCRGCRAPVRNEAVWDTRDEQQHDKKRLLILGEGFADLYAAMELKNSLAHDQDVEITLINRENFFLFTPMLHEVAASDLDLTANVNPIRKMLKRVNFFEGEIESVDLAQKQVVVSHGLAHHQH